MKNIITVNIENIVKESEANFFLFFLQTEGGRLFSWRGSGFSQVTDGHNQTTLFDKFQAIEQYYRALRDARQETMPSLFEGGGRLDVSGIKLP